MGFMPENDQPRRLEESEAERVSFPGVILLAAYLLLVALGALYAVFALWPSEATLDDQSVRVLFWCGRLVGEQYVILLACAAGVLGASIHALRSFFWYVGQQDLKRNWVAMYLFLPVVGGALAVVFFVVFRGGLISADVGAEKLNPVGFAALGAIVGMFSQQAILKLKAVAETLFTRPAPGKDSRPQGTDTTED